jgi:hypothetical protein
VVEAEPLEGALECRPGPVLTWVLDEQIRGDVQLGAWDTAVANGTSDRFLVLIGGGGVDTPVADLQGGGHRLLCLVRRDLKDAEAENRHLGSIVQCDGWSFSDDHSAPDYQPRLPARQSPRRGTAERMSPHAAKR